MSQPGNPRAWLPLAIVVSGLAIVTLILSCTEACGQEAECPCCGSSTDGPVQMAAKSSFTYTIDYGEFAKVDRHETVRRIHESFRQLGVMADWQFKWVPLHEKADFRFEFYGYGRRELWAWGLDKNNKKIKTFGDPRIVANAYYGGLAHDDGRIYLLSDRPMSPTGSIGLVMHEVMHVLGWKHSNSESDLMHPNLTSVYPSPQEVIRIQRGRGPPKLPFHPVPRMEQGAKVRAAKAKWEQLKSDRQTAQYQGTWRPEMQSDVLDALGVLVKENNEWWRINNEWSRVSGVMRLGVSD